MVRKKSVSSLGVYLTKPSCIANYFNDYFMNEVSRIRDKMALIGVSVLKGAHHDQYIPFINV